MSLKDKLTSLEFWVVVGLVVAGIYVGATQIHKLPAKVQANSDNVQKLAGTVDTYIVEQRALDEGREKREEMMWELIKEK